MKINNNTAAPRNNLKTSNKFNNTLKLIWKYKSYYVLLTPCILFFIIFKYLPMYGVCIAFKDFSPFKGITGSPWVGTKHFVKLFHSPDFWNVFRNTMLISLYKVVFGFPVPIFLAILLNELRNIKYKKVIQTIVYLPHFVSWVILGSIIAIILSPSSGVVNYILKMMGLEPIFFLASKKWFRSVLVISEIYKNSGWGTIVYLAAITAINPQIYEAALVDGANRWKQIWHITLPAIRSVIMVMLILSVGRILDAGFQQILVLYNPAVYDVADTFKTYAYRIGLTQSQYSFATALELFKGIVSLTLIMLTNKFAKLIGESGVW